MTDTEKAADEVPQWLKDLGLTAEDVELAVLQAGERTLKRAPARLRRCIDNYLSEFISEEPYYSYLIMQMSKFYTYDIPTMGVSWDGQGFCLAINPDFVDNLHKRGDSGPEIKAVLMHECEHVHEGHLTTRAPDWSNSREKAIFQAASDLAANTTIHHEYKKPLPYCPWLPGLRPGTPLPTKASDGTVSYKYDLKPEKWQLIRSQPLDKVDHVVMNCKPLMSLEYYTQLLREVWPETGEGGNGAGTDNHDLWSSVPEHERQFVKEKMREMMRKAMVECDSSGSWGSVSAARQAEIRRFVNNEVDWREEFRQWMGLNYYGNDKFTTRRKINRRYPLMHPGRRTGRGIHVAVLRDESTSVTNKVQADLCKELAGMSELASVTVVPFDTDVDEANIKTYGPGETIDITRHRQGGTAFTPPTNWINREENTDKFDVCVFLTDGEAEQPPATNIPRLWVIAPGRKLLFATDDKVITLTNHGED